MCAVTVLAAQQGHPAAIALDANDVYWTDSYDGRIMTVPKSGGTPVQLAIGHCPHGVAVDATNVYWADNCGTGVMKVPKAGGAPTQVTAVALPPWGVAVDASNVYFTTNDGVWKGPIGGGSATKLWSGTAMNPGGYEIAVDATTVYFTTLNGNVLIKVPITGGPSTQLAMSTQTVAIALDAANVYWTAGNGPTYQVSKGGGTPVQIATGSNAIDGVATDGTHVYIADTGGLDIVRVPVGGGTPLVIASQQVDSAVAIAVDATSVYWTEVGSPTNNFDDGSILVANK